MNREGLIKILLSAVVKTKGSANGMTTWNGDFVITMKSNEIEQAIVMLEKSLLPPAEGAEKSCLSCGLHNSPTYHDKMWCRDCQQFSHYKPQPTAEGAETYLRKHPFLLGETEDGEDYLSTNDIELIKQLAPILEDFATLHAQRIAENIVSERLAPDEDVEVAIQDALYATGRFTTDECTLLAEGILMYIKDHKIINLKTKDK